MSPSVSRSEENQPSPDRLWMSTVAGILDVCAGVSALIGSGVLAFIAVAARTIPLGVEEPIPEWPFAIGFGMFFALSMMLVILGVPAVIGGIYALRRSRGVWPIVGAIAATLSCFVFGIPAIVLTVMYVHDLPRKKPSGGREKRAPK